MWILFLLVIVVVYFLTEGSREAKLKQKQIEKWEEGGFKALSEIQAKIKAKIKNDLVEYSDHKVVPPWIKGHKETLDFLDEVEMKYLKIIERIKHEQIDVKLAFAEDFFDFMNGYANYYESMKIIGVDMDYESEEILFREVLRRFNKVLGE